MFLVFFLCNHRGGAILCSAVLRTTEGSSDTIWPPWSIQHCNNAIANMHIAACCNHIVVVLEGHAGWASAQSDLMCTWIEILKTSKCKMIFNYVNCSFDEQQITNRVETVKIKIYYINFSIKSPCYKDLT